MLIKQEFIMTTDTVPVPATKGLRRQCKNCKQLAKRIVKGLCNCCEVYKLTTGNNRPKKLFSLSLICRNSNCKQSLKDIASSNSGLCNACYRYEIRTGNIRPEKLCKGKVTKE